MVPPLLLSSSSQQAIIRFPFRVFRVFRGSSSPAFVVPQNEKPAGRAWGLAPGGSHESRSSGLSGPAQVSLLGILILVDRKLQEASEARRAAGGSLLPAEVTSLANTVPLIWFLR